MAATIATFKVSSRRQGVASLQIGGSGGIQDEELLPTGPPNPRDQTAGKTFYLGDVLRKQ